MPDEPVLRAGHLVIPLGELEWRFSRSGGPGGQHANTADTRVEVRFDIDGSTALDDDDRARLRARFGPSLRVVAAAQRSQLRNRAIALERLAQRLEAALRRDPPRRPSRPSRSAVERRLSEKRRQAARKADRSADRRPSDDF